MKQIFKKVTAIAASALMVGMSMGVAAAADYPAPFVVGGAANVAIVYGTGAGVDPSDLVQAGYVQANLQSFMGGSGTTTTTTGDNAWQVGTNSDDLEIGESVRDIATYIGNEEWALLADGSISNGKGEAKSEQYFYFEDVDSSAVNYTQDDDENQELFFKIKSGKVIARYVMDFTTNLKSDITASTMVLPDIETQDLTFLGKEYTVVIASNGTSGIELTMVGGGSTALSGTVVEGTPLTVGDYTVSVSIVSASDATFTVTKGGVSHITGSLAKGGFARLSDLNNENFVVSKVSYEGYSEGTQSAEFYIGGDKIELKNGTSMTVNSETINEAAVLITHTEASSDVSVSQISVNMTAEDDLYVPVDGKLSEADDLDEPEALFGQNWDIQFEGLEAADYETITLDRSTDLKYVFKWENHNSQEIRLPLWNGNTSGIYGGETSDKRFVMNPNGSVLGGYENITDNDYFLLHTANPVSSTTNAKTILVQYKGADKIRATTSPTVTFTINPGPDQEDKAISVTQSTGAFTLRYGDGTWNFRNASDGETKDYEIVLLGDDYHTGTAENNSMSQYIRTGYNTLVNITQQNATNNGQEVGAESQHWYMNVTVDDANRDDDEVIVTEQVFFADIVNSSATDVTLSWTGTTGWLTDPEESTHQNYVTRYGATVAEVNPADSPPNMVATVPKSIVKPLVYFSMGDVSVTSTVAGGVTSLGDVLVKDKEVSTVSTKNLVVIGGSCINSAAATLVGGAKCTSDFTTTTGIGAGQFVIKGYAASSITSKIALLVAGYETADTMNAVTYLRTQTVDTDKEYKGTSATSATMVTETDRKSVV